jgi:thiamine-phosphate pyrophosphorylase
MPGLPRLYAIVDVEAAGRAGWRADDLARAYLDGGARFLQIRAKQLPSGAFLDLCDRVVRGAEPCDALVIVNDRADLALASGAAGVHIGQTDLAPSSARALVGANAIVGLSTHTNDQIARATAESVTYVAVGPVFGTRTKETGYEAVGLDLVRAARRLVPSGMAVVAIGGITLDRAAEVLDAGASAVAVIGDLMAGGNPAERVSAYLRVL